MSRYDYPDASLATIAPLTEEQLAGQRARAGDKVRFAHGRYWREFGSGFWEALHWLARMTEGEARRPGPCWGYRATLDDAAADGANASLPLHLIVDIAAHDESALPRDARYDLRRLARRGVRIVQLTDMRLFGDQGYEVMLDWRRRVGLAGPTPTRERYLQDVGRRLADDGWLVLAGIEDDRLLGYMTAWAVDDSAYLHESTVAAVGLGLGLSNALNVEAVQVLKRSGKVVRVTTGVHQPEMPSLTAYKIRHGFPVVHVPSRAWMVKPLDLILRARRPLAYYRLTGRGSESVTGPETG